jgi:AraC-like DNA-binding protein
LAIVGTGIGARVWRVADLGGIDLLRADVDEFSFHPHAHEEFFVALTEGGQVAARYRGGTHALGTGDMIVLNPEEAHAGGPPPNCAWTYRALYLRPELLAGIAADVPGGSATPRFGGVAVRDRQLAARLRRFHRLTERPDCDPLQRQTVLVEALERLVSRHAAGPQSPMPAGREAAAVRRCVDYLEAHARETVTLETLAAVAGLSPFQLCRVFGAAVGMTPHAYQTHVRVRRARALLRAGSSATDAATAVGFYDQAHLTRQFKRIVGLTPARYARATAVGSRS